MRNFLSFVVLLYFVAACQLLENKETDTLLARVGDSYLYQSDLNHINFSDNEEDSTSKAKSFINAWINKQLLLEKALQNLSEEQADFSDQLENYKNSLLIYAYENQLIKQKLDTVVSSEEIKSYYKANKHNFKLKEQLFQLRFVKYLNSAPIQDSLTYWLNADEDFKKRLMDYCTQFAQQCHLDTSKWVSLSSIKKILPAAELNIEQLRGIKEKKIMLSDSLESFMANVFASRQSESPAPISYIEDRIIEIIVNKRKLQLLEKVKKEIYEEATLKKSYEIYE